MLQLESALSTSQKLKIDENKLGNPQFVLEFLKSNGFYETHITKLVEKHPPLLVCRVESNLKPKLEYLAQIGYRGTFLPELIISNPYIVRASLCRMIKPCFEFLKEKLVSIEGRNDLVIKGLKRSSWLFTSNLDKILKPNFDLLVKGGVPVSNITTSLLFKCVLTQKPDSCIRSFNAVKGLGIDPKSPAFVYALRVMAQLSEST
ncbi:uncharacterized protein [Rutidosis leptorrhynchoides]|uniref:uncharacterized protein n=1 Tax=Rutidosis leptorrhynchoides TaxID=125765 RepID=UPI003A9A47CE